ncbi:hypothetical protein EYF80_004706 [Liparis tanakae]|uniref:Uncharacterized protein n=1 Tax=Liparis tanakae TaxID=230148 RepID=A0A4Z2J6D6_9TELE|nr:hypothetical protein EYF80_004706 [Liparis tanakae]
MDGNASGQRADKSREGLMVVSRSSFLWAISGLALRDETAMTSKHFATREPELCVPEGYRGGEEQGPHLMPLVEELWKFCSSCGRPSMASHITAREPSVSTYTAESSSSRVTTAHSTVKPKQKSRSGMHFKDPGGCR